MAGKMGIAFVLVGLVLLTTLVWSGCRPEEELETEEEIILEGEGILVGQIDSQSVEIDMDGQPEAFALGVGVSVTGISDGAAVIFTYVEEETRPVLLSIEAIDEPDKIFQGEGIYTGQHDAHSVEIETNGEYKVFSLDDEVTVDNIAEGSKVSFTYRETEHRPVLLSIDVIEEPVDEDKKDELIGEGVLVGLADAHSVEIEMNRAFMLKEGVGVEGIEEGSKVAFTFTEDGQRAVLDSIEAVDVPPEGDIMHGTLIGQIDSHSVEIRYFQVFALGEGVNVEGIEDGSEIVFTYRLELYRPVLTSVTSK